MKKSLLALAVMGAFAGAAYAQSSVTVYGIVDLGFDSSSNGAASNARTNGIKSGGQSASRVGFKGTEDLGNGLKALFQLEATIAADTGAGFAAGTGNSGGFNRFATVGLQSAAFGTVLLGRQTSVIKDAYDQIDPFGDGGTVGAISNIFFNGTLSGDQGRISNSVKYTSNAYSGFKANAAYAFGEAAGSTSANSSFGLGLGYANGPLNVQYAYHNVDQTVAATLIPTNKSKIHLLGATYDFGILKLHGAFADTKVDPAAVGVNDSKYRNYLVGVSAPVGPGTIFASYSVNDNKSTGSNNQDTKKFAVAYSYDLSKRTNLYTGYSKTSNDSAANLSSGITGVTAGRDPSTFNVGIRHKF